MTEAAALAYGPPDFRAGRQRLLIAGASALGLCASGAWFNPSQFFHSYLLGFMLWFGVAMGSLAVMMIHHLSGGAWGIVIRRPLEAATRTLPVLALLFVPILLGMRSLYIWSRPEVVSGDEILRHKQLYLNVWFFIVRAVIYFGAWAWLVFLLNRWSAEQDRVGGARIARRLQRLSAGGLVIYGLTITFASFDWLMSLEPHWFSTIFGVLVMGGQGLSALAFVIAVAVLLASPSRAWSTGPPPLAGVIRPAHFHDLGKLLLAFVMLWAYFSFSQFLIIWSGNIAEEIPWYLHRLTTGWQWIGLLLVVFHFAIPFLLLLSRGVKRNPQALAALAIAIVFMRLVDLFWLIGPEIHQHGLRLHWMDAVAPAGIGCVWLAAFAWQLAKRPLLPLGDPQLEEALAHGRH